MQPAVAYFRVSKDIQDLGIDAQKAAVARFVQAEGFQVLEAFEEKETGRGADALERRPQLAAAIKRAKRAKCPILVAKLDRLSRNVHFISGLMEHRTDFIVTELGRGVKTFMLHIYAAVAQEERDLISRRTKEALAAAKARGVKLGGANENSRRIAAAAADRAQALRPIFDELSGLSSRALAEELNRRQVPTPNGGRWHQQTVIRVQQRLAR
jgi:DNA invertase Pin-like site-specific DNA recombinase